MPQKYSFFFETSTPGAFDFSALRSCLKKKKQEQKDLRRPRVRCCTRSHLLFGRARAEVTPRPRGGEWRVLRSASGGGACGAVGVSLRIVRPRSAGSGSGWGIAGPRSALVFVRSSLLPFRVLCLLPFRVLCLLPFRDPCLCLVRVLCLVRDHRVGCSLPYRCRPVLRPVPRERVPWVQTFPGNAQWQRRVVDPSR